MGKRDDSIGEVAEYLREEATEVGHVGPRRYEHWEIRVERDGQDWMFFAVWTLRRDPTEPAVRWLFELAVATSLGKTPKFEDYHVYEGKQIRFTWKEELPDEHAGIDREGEQASRGLLGEEEDSWGLVGALSRDLEEDE